MVEPRHPRPSLEDSLSLDVGLGSINRQRRFVVPTTPLVFVGNAHRVSRDDLLLRCAIRCSASEVMRREGFGEHPIDLIGPTTVMFDNLVDNLSHVSLLTLLSGLIVGQVFPKRLP
jgi:hypothetical protein